MSTSPKTPYASGQNKMMGRTRANFNYLFSKRGKFMMTHSSGAAVAYGATGLAMLVFVLNFKPILGRIPYIKNSYPLPPPKKS